MIAHLLVGVATAAATVVGVWLARSPGATEAPEALGATTYLTMPVIAAPLLDGSRVRGYALVRFGFEAKEAALARLPLPPRAVVTDALHTLAFEGGLDPQQEGFEIGAMRERVLAALDARLGGAIVKVLVLQIDVLEKEEIRSNGIRRRVIGAARTERAAREAAKGD